MNELPVDLAPPLHLMEPGGPSPWWLLLLPLLLFLVSRWLKDRPKDAPQASTPPPAAAPPTRRHGLADEIDALREQYQGTNDYRRACHELAKLLRQHVAGAMPLTAREIASTLKSSGISKIFPLLAELQFSREEPRNSDFVGICELAQEATQEGAELE